MSYILRTLRGKFSSKGLRDSRIGTTSVSQHEAHATFDAIACFSGVGRASRTRMQRKEDGGKVGKAWEEVWKLKREGSLFIFVI